MTIENGGEQPANDTALADAQADTTTTDQAQEAGEGTENEEGEGDGQSREPEWAEIEIDGKKYRVEAAAKDGYLRQADYTRKTQEVAEARRALEQEREQFKGHTEAQKAHFQAATKLAAIDEQLNQYANVDWPTLYSTNPDLYHQHKAVYDQLKDKRDAAARDYSTKEQESRQVSERESANRLQKAIAEIAKQVEGWAPGNELDVKLQAFGASKGYSPQEMAKLALESPKFVRDMDRLRVLEEAAKKQQTQQSFQQSQQAKPVTRVGGNSGSAARKTTDASGDALSTDEWVKRELQRLESLRAKAGR